MAGIIVGLFGAAATWGAIAAVREGRRHGAAQTLIDRLQEADPACTCFYVGAGRASVETINGARSRREPFVIALSPSRVGLYPLNPDLPPRVEFAPAELRWFGRPKKYSPNTNEIWLHVEHAGGWQRLVLRLPRAQMQALVRALKGVATPEQVTAYRRRRPYIHAGPLFAAPAAQDMLGAWVLGAPGSLYLTPSHLVVLDGTAVRRTIALERVQKIAAVRRLDQPGTAGLVRFEADGEQLAFALEDHDTFAEALAEAARRTLEDPVQWQRKKKKPDALDALDDEDE
ncbi:hypothetical protein [Aggregatilinea lenta]|uniref:hypothetical protein n=1 Tax=Aggregatilinea lenta TaxID=913108 RepID=UPI000E5AF9D3|nr:hypothetical protein [Aggregatilinea lenta]